jgi:hypothetical protein
MTGTSHAFQNFNGKTVELETISLLPGENIQFLEGASMGI